MKLLAVLSVLVMNAYASKVVEVKYECTSTYYPNEQAPLTNDVDKDSYTVESDDENSIFGHKSFKTRFAGVVIQVDDHQVELEHRRNKIYKSSTLVDLKWGQEVKARLTNEYGDNRSLNCEVTAKLTKVKKKKR